ncbi:hypothetical protein FKG94_28320 [Exilibacterium tricleocarpae]|uniref:Uncharacterized protein n=1 Tax=Exilibacterium tricleocarpae TaxID=2591008 RepID=A0A545SL26_9GAMM|nr:hypothetical protein [Exilibacterium tricleocarpae]TQV65683.1 hypothetical protein FKG94_28320 [Exilibacterium tricleocarpae]
MEFSYRDKHYIRSSLKVYLKHLKKINEDDENISEDEFSEIQDDIMLISNLLHEVEQDLEQLKLNASGGAKLHIFGKDTDEE